MKTYTRSTTYWPIDCNFHDFLLEKATLKESCTFVFASEAETFHIEAQITDIFTRQGEEFIVLDSGMTFRLDCLQTVNGIQPPGQCEIQ